MRSLFPHLSRDLGLDLGTSTTLLHVSGSGILLREPSVVALDKQAGRVMAVGEEAKRMLGRTPAGVLAARPLQHGVIADFEMTELMLGCFIAKVHRRRDVIHPTVLVGIPSGTTEVERRAIKDAALRAGARRALLIEEPMAAAVGVGLPIFEPTASMVMDIGGGTTEVAVISLGGVVANQSIRVAGDAMDQAIVAYLRREFNLLVGERTAEELKIEIGSAFPTNGETGMLARGRDLVTGLPKALRVSSREIRLALEEPVKAILDALRITLEETPPELASDLMERGMVLVGGGALLRGLDRLIERETGMPVRVELDPATAVVVGAGRVLDRLDQMKRLLVNGG